jgi:hypothetical protein
LVECVTAVGIGILADRTGSPPAMRGGLIFQVLFAFPFFWLLDTRGPAAVFLGRRRDWRAARRHLGGGAAFFARFFPAETRYSGISISREFGTIIGGGLFPLAATAILAGMHQSWPIAAIIGGRSVLGLFSLGLAGERRTDPRRRRSRPVTPLPGQCTRACLKVRAEPFVDRGSPEAGRGRGYAVGPGDGARPLAGARGLAVAASCGLPAARRGGQ